MQLSRVLDIKVNYSVSFLIEKLKVNLENHIDDYEKALIVYKKDLYKHLMEIQNICDDILRKNDVELKDFNSMYSKIYTLNKPVDASKMYEQYISLLSQSTDKELTLALNDANAIINDSWDWAIQAKTVNSTYSSRF